MERSLDCPVWTFVDFGKGPVEVRCTEPGWHLRHRCEIIITIDDGPDEDIRRNVFTRERTQ